MNLYKVRTANQVATKNGQPIYVYLEQFVVAPHLEGAIGFMRMWLGPSGTRIQRIKEISRNVVVVKET